MELLLIGFRNISRNRRRTWLNVIALAIGTAMMIVLLGWVRGYFTSFYEGIIRFDTGHVQVLNDDYLAQKRRLPLDLLVTDTEAVAARLREATNASAVAPRIDFAAQIGNGLKSARMAVRAIDPEAEAAITVLHEHIIAGEYLGSEGGALVGEPLADKLGLAPGEALFVSAVDAHGVENLIDVTVSGIHKTGYPPLDESMVYLDIGTARKLLDIEGAATSLVIGLGGGPDVASEVALANAVLGEDLIAYSWREFAQVVVRAVQADAGGFAMILVVVYLLVVVGILNSSSMSVQERTREIGTLRAIGMKRRTLASLLLSESAAVSLIAAAVGFAVAGAIALYLGQVGLDMSALARSDLPLPFGDRFRADFRAIDFAIGAAVTVVTAVLGSIIPTRRAARLPIAEALGAHLE